MLGPHAQVLLIVTGAVTMSVVAMGFAPKPVLQLLFGQAPTDPISLLLMRHWALVVACIGALLLLAAFNPALRTPVLWVGAIEKLALVAMVVGTPLRRHGLAVMVAGADLVMALAYLGLLAGL